jgi:acyl-CoA synthetase (AMP-forming)/AMP-acid ligase II
MESIVHIAENQIESGGGATSFSYLDDGENPARTVSLAEMREDAVKIATLLPKTSPVLILLPQGISFIRALFGCFYAGAIAVPAAVPNRNRGIERLLAITAEAGVRVAITDRSTLANLKRWFGDDPLSLTWICIDEIENDATQIMAPFDLPAPDSVAFLQYTSGSTGNPKGVMVTHENIVANSRIIKNIFQNDAASRSVCWLPMFHDMGLIDGIIQPVFSGFPVVLMSPTHFLQRPVRWLRAITKYGATYSGGPNFAFDHCTDRISDADMDGLDLTSLRCLYNGSERVRSDTIRRFTERFSRTGFSKEKMLPCYGLAESTLAVTAPPLGTAPTIMRLDEQKLRQNEVALTSSETVTEIVGCGFTGGDTQLRIVDGTSLQPRGEMEIGEIWVAGKSIAAGYRGRSDLSSDTFITQKGKRFLRTGDLGFVSGKQLFVTGRIKDTVIINGQNHCPHEIERTVALSHYALQSNGCAAFSVEVEMQEKLVLVQEVRRSFLKAADYGAVLSSIMSDVSQKIGLAPYDILLIQPNELPKTTSGKIRRSECRQLWSSRGFAPLAALRDHFSY